MKKNKILLLAIATLFLNGCSCSISSRSRRIDKTDTTQNSGTELTNNTGTNNSNNNQGGSGDNDDYTDLTVIMGGASTYYKQGSVSIEGRVQYWEELPQPTLTSPNGVKSGTPRYFYTERKNKNVSVDLNNLYPWQLYNPPYESIHPGEYTLIAYYVNDLGDKCYTSTYDFTAYKGVLDPEDFAISNGNHNHVLPYIDSTDTLADVEDILTDYDCFYIDNGYYDSGFGRDGVVTFDDPSINLVLGMQTYTLVFTDDAGCFEPFKCDLTFSVTDKIVRMTWVKLNIKQTGFQKEMRSGEEIHLPYNESQYELSLPTTESSSLYEINLEKTTGESNKIMNPGYYKVYVSLKNKDSSMFINPDGTICYEDLEFTIHIDKKEVDFETYTYFTVGSNSASVADRVGDGGSCSLRVSQKGTFRIYQKVGDGSEVGGIQWTCRIEIVSGITIIERYIDYIGYSGYSITALNPGKAVVDIYLAESTYYKEKKVATIEINVLPSRESYNFQNEQYYSSPENRTTVYLPGDDFYAKKGVETLRGHVSGFYFNPKGALEMFIYYSCDNVTAINNSVYPSIKIISVEGNEILATRGFYGSTINVSNETFDYKIPEKYRYSDLYVLVDNQNAKSGSGSIYVNGIAFKYI